ncbi:peptidoglycan bridge formation glycyltransferase FemA/FemB family protein [Candidatus Saccharibacteria bacterium]|nr:peptidoglycan bridge formation glycyltransferase FemA/FemB family protein [Candidatus Saccharibacteria bacterium]
MIKRGDKIATLRYATPGELTRWDDLIANNPGGGDPYQSSAMAAVKSRFGWTPEYWVYETEFGSFYATVLTRRFIGIGRLAYIMRGPNIKNSDQLRAIVSINSKKTDFFAIKMEPSIEQIPHEMIADESIGADLKHLLKVRNTQPHTQQVVVDLTRSADEILASFSQTARREIRAAEKDGIIIKKSPLTEKNMRDMYRLYSAMSQRTKLFIRPYDYYRRFWMSYGDLDQGELFLAHTKSGDAIAGAFIIKFGQKAIYKDGGSVRTDYKHFAHLLQWSVMLSLKESGVTEYNLMSTQAPGLNTFKRSFSPRDIVYIGTYDQVLNRKAYQKWLRWGERLNQLIASRIKKTTLF